MALGKLTKSPSTGPAAPTPVQHPRQETREELEANFSKQLGKRDQRPTGPAEDPHRYESVALALIVPDPKNIRTGYLKVVAPTRNPFPEGTSAHARAAARIAEIIEFSEHLKIAPLEQAITVYKENGRYLIVSGHMRFFAMLVAFGSAHTIRCKVLDEAPRHIRIRQLRENETRINSTPQERIHSFMLAQEELAGEEINGAEAWNTLGLSKSQYYRYSSIAAVPDVVKALDEGKLDAIEKAEQAAKIVDGKKRALFIESGGQDNTLAINKGNAKKPGEKRVGGRPKTAIMTPKINNVVVVQRIVESLSASGHVSEESFKEIDWFDMASVEKAWHAVIKKLSK